jgi:chaperonin GroEL
MKPERTVFVIMPFVKAFARNKGHLKSFFENNIKKSIESADLAYQYWVRRSDETFNITDKIIRDLFTADVVIADLSGELPNPNVMYELGVRLAISQKPVILIREDNDQNKNVFDITGFYAHPYDPLNYLDLEKHIIEKLRRLESGEETYESPVLKVVQGEAALIRSALHDVSPKDQREIVLRGVEIMSKYLASAYGPRGSLVSVASHGERIMTKWGVEIARHLTSGNILERLGLEQMNILAGEVYDSVGDGTKTAILFAHTLFTNAHQAGLAGSHPKDVAAGIRKAVVASVEYLTEVTSRNLTSRQLFQLASTAAGNTEIASRVIELVEKIGPGWRISVGESITERTEVEVIQHPQFNRGYISADFINDFEQGICVLNNCFILLCLNKVNSIHSLAPLLEQIVSTKKPLLIIADDVEGAALDALRINNEKGILGCAAVRAPGGRETRWAFMQDLALLTGAKLIDDATRILANASIKDLGSAKKVIIEENSTTIIGGGGRTTEVKARAKFIQAAIQNTKVDSEKYELEYRLANLIGKKAHIRVGGTSPVIIREEIYRTQSALSAIRSAGEEGWVAGGGLTLFHMRTAAEKLLAASSQTEISGINAVINALQTPISQLIENSRLDVKEVLSNLDQSPSSTIGLNSETGEIQDLTEIGVLDSAKTLRKSLELASARICAILETGAWDLETIKLFDS